MATTLGEAVVRFTSQFASFTAGVQAVQKGMTEVESSVRRAASVANSAQGQFNTFGSSITKAWGSLKTQLHMEADRSPGIFGRMAEGIKGTIGGLVNFAQSAGFAIYGLQQIGQTIGGVVTGFFAQSAAMEQTRQGFVALLGSTKAADSMLRQLQQFAATTPFEFTDVAKATRLMLGMGFAARDVIPMLTAVGDAAGGVGAGAEGINRIILALGQMQAKGKITAGDMMQLTDLGIPAWKILADAMHLSVAQVMDLSQKGLLPANVAVGQLTTGMEKMFKGQMASQMNTWIGQWSNFKDTVGFALRGLADPILKVFEGWLSKVVTWMSNPAFKAFAETMGKNVAGSLATLASHFPAIINGFQNFFKWVSDLWAKISSLGVLKDFQKVLSDLGPVLMNVVNTALLILGINLHAAGGRAAGASKGMSDIAGAIKNISAFAAGVSGVLKTITDQFADAGIKGNIFRGALVAVGLAMLVFKAIQVGQAIYAFGAAIVTATVGLWEYVAAATAAAVANIVAFWPVYLIIAAIVLVIGLVVLAVKNWGAISKWLGDVWSAFASWFMGLLRNIGTFFVGLWTGTVSFFKGLWAGVSGWFIGLWDGILGFFRGLWAGVIGVFTGAWAFITGIVRGAITFIVNLFLWLYNHNYYFQALVDFIIGAFNRAKAFAISVWNFITSFLVGIWNTMKSNAINNWNNIVNTIIGLWDNIRARAVAVFSIIRITIENAWNMVRSYATSVWNNIMNALTGVWNTIKDKVSELWNNIVAIFQGAWDRLSGAVSSIATNFASWASGLASDALNWGASIIQGLIDGISGMLGRLKDMVGQAAGAIAGILGFHSPPKFGPAADAHKWMPNMMGMFISGVQGSTPRLQAALNMAINPPSGVARSTPINVSRSTSTDNKTIILQVDGRTMATALAGHMANQIRLDLGVQR